jgi:hypothetical protein
LVTIRCKLSVSEGTKMSASSSEPEPPFRPREKILEKQRYFQSVHKPTYLKGRYDVITSVAIPLALAVSSMFMIVSILSS